MINNLIKVAKFTDIVSTCKKDKVKKDMNEYYRKR